MKKRIQELIDKLNKASKAYYNGVSIMENIEWDSLFDELKLLENQYGIIYQNSPTQQPGFETIDKFKKKKLEYPMLSLDKTKLADDIKKFDKGRVIILSDKLDGISCEIIYQNGLLLSATTRGNSTVGEDITHNAKTFLNLPKSSRKIFFDHQLMAMVYHQFVDY